VSGWRLRLDLDNLVKQAFGEQTVITDKTEMDKGASSRRYYRISLKGINAPETAVLMELPSDAMMSDEVQGGDTPVELPFINMQRSMKNAGLPVPGILLDAVSQKAVILEDLGTKTLNAQVSGVDDILLKRWYFAATDLLSKMHRRMWPIPPESIAASRVFDRKLLRWELDHYIEWGLNSAADAPVDKEILAELNSAFDDLADEIASFPKGFVHRDYQSRNLMVTGKTADKSNLAIIDFQDAFAGPRVYDLVALLNDSYVEIPREIQRAIIDRYVSRMDASKSEIHYEFDLITIQRKLKDGGRFIFIDRQKGDPSFLPFVDKSFSRVAAVLGRLPGHSKLKNALAKADPDHFAQKQL
jgi:aminoglycoside/choline kinase family phosphotransferase